GGQPPRFAHHHLLAAPQADWESYRIGGGTVPLHTPDGWLAFYHGVALLADGGRCYQTGALLLDRDDPRRVLARTAEPIFGPDSYATRSGCSCGTARVAHPSRSSVAPPSRGAVSSPAPSCAHSRAARRLSCSRASQASCPHAVSSRPAASASAR